MSVFGDARTDTTRLLDLITLCRACAEADGFAEPVRAGMGVRVRADERSNGVLGPAEHGPDTGG
jgi:hypothetical protein